MATATKVQLFTGGHPTFFRLGVTEEQTKKTSDLLQENHDKYHIFFNDSHFHDHIVHQLLTLWALKAPTETIQKAFDENKSYQRPLLEHSAANTRNLNDPSAFKASLGDARRYRDFLLFFQSEIEKSSWQEVIQRYIFAGDERADDMLARMFDGVIHSLIHLGFGVEFEQPAIIAEGLAQAAVHGLALKDLFLSAEQKAAERRDQPSKSMAELVDALRADQVLRSIPRYNGSWSRDIVKHGGDRLAEIFSQYHIKPEDLEEQTAAMINAVFYYTAGAQRSGKPVLFDFFFIHGTNSSIFLSTFLKEAWLSDANKVRLLEWKVRYDLLFYAAEKSPDLNMNEIRNYKPKHPNQSWEEILDRAYMTIDDGHLPKLIRALVHGQRACEPYENNAAFRVKQADWLPIAHMAVDSLEAAYGAGDPQLPSWMRGAGFDEAWADLPARAQL